MAIKSGTCGVEINPLTGVSDGSETLFVPVIGEWGRITLSNTTESSGRLAYDYLDSTTLGPVYNYYQFNPGEDLSCVYDYIRHGDGSVELTYVSGNPDGLTLGGSGGESIEFNSNVYPGVFPAPPTDPGSPYVEDDVNRVTNSYRPSRYTTGYVNASSADWSATYTAPRTLYFVDGGIDNNFSSSSNWSLTDGGTGGESKPTSIDDVRITNDSPLMEIDENIHVASFVSTATTSNDINFNGYDCTVENQFYTTTFRDIDYGSGTITVKNTLGQEIRFNGTVSASASTIVVETTAGTSGLYFDNATYGNIELAITGEDISLETSITLSGYFKILGGLVNQPQIDFAKYLTFTGTEQYPIQYVAGSSITNPIVVISPPSNLVAYLPVDDIMAGVSIYLDGYYSIELNQRCNLASIINLVMNQYAYVSTYKTNGYNLTANSIIGAALNSSIDFSDQGSARTSTINVANIVNIGTCPVIQGNAIINQVVGLGSPKFTFRSFQKGSGSMTLIGQLEIYTGDNLGDVIADAGTSFYGGYGTMHCDNFTIKDAISTVDITCYEQFTLESTANVTFGGSTITAANVDMSPSSTTSMGTSVWKVGSTAATSVVDFGNKTIPSLEIVDNSLEVELSDYFTVTGQFKAYPGQSITLAPATTSPFSFGSLNMEGTAGEHIDMTGDGGVAEIDITGGAASVTYVDPTNVDASAGDPIVSLGGTGTGDYSNWTFSIDPTTIYKSIGARSSYTTGTVQTSGTDNLIVTLTGGSFHPSWGRGDLITISSVSYYVDSRDSSTQLTLQSWQTVPPITTDTSYSIARKYSSISVWESDTQSDLVSANEIQVGICYDDAPLSGDVIIAGATTSATRYRKLTVAEGHRHGGVLWKGCSTSGTMSVQENYFVLEHLRFTNTTPALSSNLTVINLHQATAQSRYTTVNSVLIHNWQAGNSTTTADGYNIYGIRMTYNGGCKILNTIITNIYKWNTESDYGSLRGLLVNTSHSQNYVYHTTITNVNCKAVFMKYTEGLSCYDSTIVSNSIAAIRKYTYDQSSIPSDTSELYTFDYGNDAGNGSNNCGQGGGWPYNDDVHGSASLKGNNALDIFRQPGPSPITGNAFYGYGFKAKGVGEQYGIHNDENIYQVMPGETGRITFDSMFVMKMLAGYKIDAPTVLVESWFNTSDAIVAYSTYSEWRSYDAVYDYDYDNQTFTRVSGDVEMNDIVEMSATGMIRIKTGYISVDWSTQPTEVGADPLTPDPVYTEYVQGHVTAAILCVGSKKWNSFIYSVSNRKWKLGIDLRLKKGSVCINAGTNLSSVPELAVDAAGVTRTQWDIGALAYADYDFISYVGNPTTDFAAILTEPEYLEALANGRLYESVSDWSIDLSGDLHGEKRREIGKVVEALAPQQQLINAGLENPYSWKQTDTSPRSWESICMSDNGKRIAMVTAQSSHVTMSDDSGSTWTSVDPTGNGTGAFASVCMSGDGNIISAFSVALGNVGKIYVSYDGGLNWVNKRTTTQGYFVGVMSKDGVVQLTYVSGEGVILISTDSGDTWSTFTPTMDFGGGPTPTAIARKWKTFSISQDGEYIIAGYGGAATVLSTPYIAAGSSGLFCVFKRTAGVWSGNEIDMGAQLGIAPFRTDYHGSSMSANGKHMTVTCRSGNAYINHTYGAIFRSDDYGVTWVDAMAGVETPKNIVSSSNNGLSPNMVTIECTGHGFVDGDMVRVTNHLVNTYISERVWVVKYVDSDHFSLWSYVGTVLTSSDSTTAAGGATGTVMRQYDWYPISMSGSGKHIIAAQGTVVGNTPYTLGNRWTSSDFGATWTEDTSIEKRDWQSVAIDRAGKRRLSSSGWSYNQMYPLLSYETYTSPNYYFQLEPYSGDRFEVDNDGLDETAFEVWKTDYSKVINCDVHHGVNSDITPLAGMTGMWARANYVELKNPRVYDFVCSNPGVTGTATGGIHVSDPSNGTECFGCVITNPIVYDIYGKSMSHGLIIEGYYHTIIGASVYNINRWGRTDIYPGQYCVGIVLIGGDINLKNCISFVSYEDPLARDFIDNSVDSNTGFLVGTDSKSTGVTIAPSTAAIEWTDPGVDFRITPTSVAFDYAEEFPEYNYDFEDVARGANAWNAGAMGVNSIIERVGEGDLIVDLPEIESSASVYHVGSGELLSILPIVRGSTTDNRPISYSVGDSYGTDLKVGNAPTISVVDGIATFNVPQTGNIGRGDKVITSSNGTVYLDIRYSYSVWGVLDNTGLPSDDFIDTVASIGRCFPTINAAVGSTAGIPHPTGIVNASFIGTSNLISAGVLVNIVCYRDSGNADTEPVTIKGYVTGARNYIFITAAGTNIGTYTTEGRIEGADSDNYYSNYPQHTTTGLAGAGYVLDVQFGDADAAIDIYDCMVGVNNMDISGTVDIGIKIYGLSDFYNLGRVANNCRVKNCIVRNSGSYGVYASGVLRYLNNVATWGCLFYNQTIANIRMLNGVSRGYIYNSIMDKGSSTCAAIMLGDGTSNVRRVDLAYNLFVGGNSDNDIVINGTVNINTFVDNRGQDPVYFSTARTYKWFGNDRIASYDDMFVDRANHNYNIKSSASQQYLAGYCSVSYSAEASYEVWPYDLKADLRAAKPRISLGCLESLFSFEFSGSDVLFIDQQKLVYYTNGDTGYFKSLSDASAYMGTTFILSMDLESALEYQKEDKILIGIKKTRSYDRKYRILKEYRAIADVYRNTIFIDKDQSFNAAFFSRAIGGRNYIFRYDMEQRKLSVGIFEELEKGMSGKNNVLNQVKLRR